MINKRMEETNTTFIFKINHFGDLRFSVQNIYEALKLNDLCYLGFVKMVILSEKICLMVLVLISFSMVLSYLVFNGRISLPSNMVIVRVDSTLTHELDISKLEYLENIPGRSLQRINLKEKSFENNEQKLNPSFIRRPPIVGYSNLLKEESKSNSTSLDEKIKKKSTMTSNPTTHAEAKNNTNYIKSYVNRTTATTKKDESNVTIAVTSDQFTIFEKEDSKRKHAVLTYDDPETYKGAIVQGWPPSKNRSTPLYIKENDSFSIIPAKNKLANKELIVIVQSRPNAFEARQTNRDTWIKTANLKTSVIFLVGSDSTFSSEIQTKLRNESEKYSDIIMAGDLIEDYSNLTLKTIYTLKYFLQADHFLETTPNYLMKVDDDTFVNLPKLYNLITEDKSLKDLKYLLVGHCFCSAPRVFKVQAQTKYAGKWQVPTYMYNGDTYPVILSGSGYVLSRAAADCLYQESLKIPYFHLEDVHVTGFAAEACGIKRLSNNGFHPSAPKTFDTKKDILAHYVSSDLKRKIFEQFKI